MAEICPPWSSANVQDGGLYFMSWTFVFWTFLQKSSLDALKNKESGKVPLYPVKQTVVLLIGLKSKMSVKTFDVTTDALQQSRENGTWFVEGGEP